MAFVDDVRDYVNLSQAHAWRIAAPKNPDEPGLVSAFLAKDMYRALRATLGKYIPPSEQLLVKGIFTHQTPKVQPTGAAKSVEIGDLLLVHQHFDTGRRKAIRGRALLFQAKRTEKPKTGSLNTGNQKIQFDLYQGWPPFKGTLRLPELPTGSTTEWDFNQPSAGGEPPRAGAEYMTVFKGHAFTEGVPVPPASWGILANGPANAAFGASGYPGGCTWATGQVSAGALAVSGVSCSNDFAQTFQKFILGTVGRAFDAAATSGPDHWSIFVNLMLQFAFKKDSDYKYTSANQNVTSGMRGRDLHLFATLPALRFSMDEELDAWFESGTRSPFNFTNALLRHARERLKENPPDGRDSLVFTGGGGHVPILYIASIGRESKLTFLPEQARAPNERPDDF